MADPTHKPRAKSQNRSGTRVTNRLVALSSAAVLTVYAAGYMRTRAAADKLFAAERPRVVIPDMVAREGALTGTREAAPRSEVAAAPTDAPRTAPIVSQPEKTIAATPIAPVQTSTEVTPTPVASPVTETSPTPTPTPAVTSLETPAPTPAPSPTPAAPAFKDGTFSGWGTSRHGDIEATVVIERGKITSAYISQCWTRYSCSWVAHLQGQVVARQSAEVDYVSGATQSANAFYYAVVQALSKAK